MTYSARLCCTTALALVLTPQISLAGVTADEVWRNYKDYLAVFGGEFVASVDQSGNTLTISESSLAFDMPFGLGNINIDLPDQDLVDNGDGTVAMVYPEPMTIGIAVEVTDKGSFSANLNFTTEGHEMLVTGDPNDVTYTWSVDQMDMDVTDIEIDAPGAEGKRMQGFEVDADGSFYDMSGVLRIKVGGLVEMQNSYSMGRQEIQFSANSISDQISHVSGGQSMVLESRATFPRNGMDIMNLAAAVREGLSVQATMDAKGNHSSDVTQKNGAVVSDQSTRFAEQVVDYGLDQDGLRMEIAVLDAEVDAKAGPEIPIAVQIQMEKVAGTFVLPLLASSELQDFTYGFSIEGLEMADNLWALFDPQEKLSRDAATITTDFTGKVLNKIDWLDFLTVKATIDSGEVPIEIHQLSMGDLLVEMAGASLSGTGEASFDNSDLEARGGIPKPSGAVDLVLSGGNGLLDNLVEMGLISDQDATGARMGVAVFSSPDPEAGEDVLKSRIEMNEEGHILANGQRIQ